jgi:predicted  nucleic acid-binding Zn-ribbon protein
MIQAILLIALGFLTATLIGVLIAPSLWSRAYRLSRRRLEQTLPVTLSEVEAAQDQLRASYAVRMRRLETALAGAKQKAAMQLVDNSRLQMQIVALRDQLADLDLKLSERRNAATVLEQTITKRFPELDREITAVKEQLQERSYEIQDLTNKLGRRTEELEAAERAAASYQDEASRLQQALEKNGADRSGRRFRRASQWTLDDYRSEYDRLNLELSKLRQQLAQLQDRDAQQAGLIKEELHKLAELILVSAQPRAELRTGQPEPIANRAAAPALRHGRPLPWPETAAAAAAVKPGGAGEGEGGSKNLELKQAQPQAPAEAPLAAGASLNESPSGALKLRAGNGSLELRENPGSAAAEPRSRLLHDAVPAKPSAPGIQTQPPQDEAATIANAKEPGEAVLSVQKQEDGVSQGSAPLPAQPDTQAPDADRASGPADPQAGEAASTDGTPGPNAGKGAPNARTGTAERGGASARSTLLDRLRGVTEETADAEK